MTDENAAGCNDKNAAGDEMIKITLKSPTTESHTIEIRQEAAVAEVREKVREITKLDITSITLIFGGLILKDHETLKSHSITNGTKVHFVVRNPTPAVIENVSSSHQPSGTSDHRSPPRTGPTSNPFEQLLRMTPVQLEQRMVQNIQALNQTNATAQLARSLSSNPDVMRSVLMESPGMRELIERNPEIGHMLNDRNLMEQTGEIIRNPNMLRETVRNHDRAISNLEGVPGGMAALHRLYRDIHEPMINAAQNRTDASNSFAALQQRGGSVDGSSAAGDSANPDVNRSTSARAGQVNSEPLPNPWTSLTTGNNTAQLRSEAASNQGQGHRTAAAREQSGMIRTLMSDPRFQEGMSAMQHLFPGNGNTTDLLGANLLGGQVQTNPPNTGSTARVGANPNTTESAQHQQAAMASLVSSMVQSMDLNQPGMPNAAVLEQRFARQLEQMSAMGFTDRQANIRALTATGGDVSLAIETLLESGQTGR